MAVSMEMYNSLKSYLHTDVGENKSFETKLMKAEKLCYKVHSHQGM
jgi:hypothetical protein